MPPASRQFRAAGIMSLASPTQDDLQRLRQAVLGPLPKIQYIAFYKGLGSNYHVLAYAKNKLSPKCWKTYVHAQLQDVTPLLNMKEAITSARASPEFEQHGSYRERKQQAVQVEQEQPTITSNPYLLAKNYFMKTLGIKSGPNPTKSRVKTSSKSKFVRTFKYKDVTPPEHKRPDDPIEACLELTPLLMV